jgi:hypothetical protein
MIVKIDRREKANFERAVASYATVKFYTIENNPQMVQAEILEQGNEISLFTAYAIGRETGMLRIYDSIE